MNHPLPLVLPPEPDPDQIPIRYACREQLAELYTRYFGPLSPRSLERWPLEWRMMNGRAVTSVRDFLAVVQREFDEAPVIKGGRRNVTRNAKRGTEQHAT